MKIIISPSKKIKLDQTLQATTNPLFLNETNLLVNRLKNYSIDEIEKDFKCSKKIAEETFNVYQNFDIEKNFAPAIFSFSGIQYTKMASKVFTKQELEYLEKHLLIIDALYGILTPLTRINNYRLSLENKISINKDNSLYNFWLDKIYKEIYKENDAILNLASEEYALIVRKYLSKKNRFIDVKFYEKENDKLIEKGVYVKIARGLMVRYIAENQLENIKDITSFNEANYLYNKDLSHENLIVFTRNFK